MKLAVVVKATIFSVVLETYGGLGVKCRDLVSKIAEEAALNGVKTVDGISIKLYLLRALSFSLQVGNSLLASHGSQRARSRLAL